jgi:L-lactate dehydrogenase complex protein LldG
MSRARILRAIAENRPEFVPLPPAFTGGLEFSDLGTQFAAAVGDAGGLCVELPDLTELGREVDEVLPGASAVYSAVAEFSSRGCELTGESAPHDCAALDIAVAHGSFGVAENGAIWLPADALQPRSALFLTQHLVLLLEVSQLCSNMHEAYERLAAAPMPAFGTFISGPSKTADIEQCLVMGAHGPRSLLVILHGAAPSSAAGGYELHGEN